MRKSIAIAAVLLAACATPQVRIGTRVSTEQLRELVPGTTVFDHSVHMLGNPLSVSYNTDGSRESVYAFVSADYAGIEESLVVVLKFDREGRFVSYKTTQNPGFRLSP